MSIENFTATADIVGRRVKICWDETGPGHTVLLRRKERDFDFGNVPGHVYSSAAFPPPDTEPQELQRGDSTVLSCSRKSGDLTFEVLRRTITPTAHGRRVEILDMHERPAGLTPGTTCYYELRVVGLDEPLRATATPTELHRSGALLYDLLPAIHRRHDVVRGPISVNAIPEAGTDNGQLRRFLDVFGAALDHLRSRADQLRDTRDVDHADHRYLPRLASLVAWELSRTQPVAVQRHEVKYAAALYRLTGTAPGCLLWVKRLTGWEAELKEFWRNVLTTNDLGNPDDPEDRGSRTLDTSDAALLADLGRYKDAADYTYDTSADGRYAHNVVGVFVTPERLLGESAAEVLERRGRLMRSTSRFLPMNLRLMVVIETETERRSATTVLSVSGGTDEVVL